MDHTLKLYPLPEATSVGFKRLNLGRSIPWDVLFGDNIPLLAKDNLPILDRRGKVLQEITTTKPAVKKESICYDRVFIAAIARLFVHTFDSF
jgi:hypothetical protein